MRNVRKICCFSAGNCHLSKKKKYLHNEVNQNPQHLLFVFIYSFFLERHFWSVIFKNISKCLKMPRNAVMNHTLTIYTLALFPVSTIVRNPSSSIVRRFIGTNSRKKFIVWYLLLCVKVHLSWTKLGLADPFLRNRNSAFRCGVHIETLLFKWRIFSYFRLKSQ